MKRLLSSLCMLCSIAVSIGIFGCKKEPIELVSNFREIMETDSTIASDTLNSLTMKSSCSRTATARTGMYLSYGVNWQGCLNNMFIGNEPNGNCLITLYVDPYSVQSGLVFGRIIYNGKAQSWKQLLPGWNRAYVLGFNAIGQCPARIETTWIPNSIPYFSERMPKSQEDVQQNRITEETRQEKSKM